MPRPMFYGTMFAILILIVLIASGWGWFGE